MGDRGAGPPLGRAELRARGRRAYLSNCTACHNINPVEKGSLGPAIAGSSAALVEARVVYGKYPPGYSPKANSRLMVAMPYLRSHVEALSVYLASDTDVSAGYSVSRGASAAEKTP